jgi:hypothetical protein
MNATEKFVADVKTKLAVIPASAVYNAYQSVFEKELHAKSTLLSSRRNKQTESVAVHLCFLSPLSFSLPLCMYFPSLLSLFPLQHISPSPFLCIISLSPSLLLFVT